LEKPGGEPDVARTPPRDDDSHCPADGVRVSAAVVVGRGLYSGRWSPRHPLCGPGSCLSQADAAEDRPSSPICSRSAQRDPRQATVRNSVPAIFKTVSWQVEQLVSGVQQGSISLPDLQRPFVWSSTKVRDLFDSMYRGYPVGTLM